MIRAVSRCLNVEPGGHVGQVFDHQIARQRNAFGDAKLIVSRRVANQEVAQVLAGRKHLQQNRQCVTIAREQRCQGVCVARCRDESFQIVERHVRVADNRRPGGVGGTQGAAKEGSADERGEC